MKDKSEIKILIVDDIKSNLMLLRLLLVDLGFLESNIVTAENGLEALRKITNILSDNRNFDLVITDQNMPYLSGIELLKGIKKLEVTEIIPVIISTSDSTESFEKEATTIGASGFVPKPIEYWVLKEEIRKALKTRDLFT